MKKLLCVLMALGSILLAASALAESDAWARIYDALERLGYPAEDLQPGQCASDANGTTFSVIIRDHPADEDGLLVGVITPSGDLQILQTPGKIILDRQLETELKACFNRDDCYLLLPEVCRKYRAIFATMTEEEIDEQVWPLYADVVRLDVRLPEEGAIPWDTAYALALDHLAEQPGWSSEPARMLRLAISAYCVPEDVGRPVYLFYLEPHSQFEAAYSSDRAYSAYHAKLEGYFGGKLPCHMCVLVDAMDGSLAAKPTIEFAPIQFNYLEHVVRAPAFLSAMDGEGDAL